MGMKHRIDQLQLVRLLAAMLVLVGHARDKVAAGTDTLGGAANFYASGVDVFFVLSGFIMFVISRDDAGRPWGWLDFLRKRLTRVVPPYWFFTTLMLVAMAAMPALVSSAALDPLHILGSYLFVPVDNPQGEVFPVLALGWTLNHEMFFYVLFAVGLLLPWPRGAWLTACLVASCGVIGALVPPQRVPASFWLNPIVFEFLLGMALGAAHQAGWRVRPGVGVVLSLLGVVGLWFGANGFQGGVLVPERALWMGAPALLVVAGAALIDAPRASGRLMRAGVLGGDASYALYLSHPFTLAVCTVAFKFLGWPLGVGTLLLACCACVGVAMAFHLWLEKPVVNRLNRLLSRPRIETSCASST